MNAITALEVKHERRIGLYAENLHTGATVTNRSHERFAMCSTFKPLGVAAVLTGRLVLPDKRALSRRAYYPPSLVAGAGYAPRMAAWQEAGYTPTVAQLCEVSVADSDNAAANWLLELIGGPQAITSYARSLGDQTTILTRWEPALNYWDLDSELDATTPRAIGLVYADLLVGHALRPPERRLLKKWMASSTTGLKALRQGLPAGWTMAEKTGSGATYGTRNDVGVAWNHRGQPIVISCLTRSEDINASTDTGNLALADVGQLCAQRLG